SAIHRIRFIEQIVKGGGVDLQAARREELIKRISKAIGSHLDADLVLQHAVNELGRHLAVSRCYIIILNPGNEEATTLFNYSASGVSTLEGSPFSIFSNPGITQAMHRGEPVMFVDAQSEELLKPIVDFLRKKSVRSTLYHMIYSQGEKQVFICLDQCD